MFAVSYAKHEPINNNLCFVDNSAFEGESCYYTLDELKNLTVLDFGGKKVGLFELVVTGYFGNITVTKSFT